VGELGLSPAAQQWVNVTLLWIGFGTLAGLLARSLIPGRELGGALGTVMVGIVGSVVGPLTLCHFLKPENFNPIGPLGFLAAVGGAVVCLLLLRIVATVVPLAPREELEE
jgi:uncharacterized membrane protein YeaQ/YmgE (transglycosylase-associated protein family)